MSHFVNILMTMAIYYRFVAVIAITIISISIIDGQTNKKLSSSSSSSLNKKKSSCDPERVDKCAIAMVPLTDPELLENPPRNMSQMNYWCRKFKQSIECVRQYSQQCLQSESRRVFSIMSYSISKMAKRYCGSVRAKKDLLEFFKCAGNDLRKYAQPLFDLSGDLHSIPTIKPANLRIPLSCW